MLRIIPVRRTLAIVTALALFSSVAPALAQSTGAVKGKVVDVKGEPVQDAKITIEFKDGMSRKFETKSNKKGEYFQIGIQPGNYSVTATKEGVGTQSFDVRVRLGNPMEVNFQLAPTAPGGGQMSKEDVELRKLTTDGITALNSQQWDAALPLFQQALVMRPDCFPCQLGVGESYRGKGDYDSAEVAMKKAMEMKPDAPEPYRVLRDIYNNQKKFDDAANMAAEAAKRTPATPGGTGANAADLYNQAVTFWNANKYAEAKTALAEALAADPNHAEAHFLKGTAHLNAGELKDALTHFEAYIKVAPTGPKAKEAEMFVTQLKTMVK
ncbi:MAG: tetratricopeptide repeat protein [Acidobacteria bacterium]|nr:tetratricopeptide repeat protein [Acidobacteriota bacterium]